MKLKNLLIPVLELGTYTGFSAVAWYEGTRATNAEIVTLDLPSEGLKNTRKYFKELAVDDRITVIEGPAAETSVSTPLERDLSVSFTSKTESFPRLKTIQGQFDLIFFDADKANQTLYLDLILEQRLLSPKGIILIDNGT